MAPAAPLTPNVAAGLPARVQAGGNGRRLVPPLPWKYGAAHPRRGKVLTHPSVEIWPHRGKAERTDKGLHRVQPLASAPPGHFIATYGGGCG
jgi:hypothetical protein